MKENKQNLKDEFVRKFVYRESLISDILAVMANILYFFLNIAAVILMKISAACGWIYTKIWPFLRVSSYDHRFDFLRGIENYGWYERAVLALEKIKPGGSVLDIGCGDGIYSGLFYSGKAKKVDAIDIDRAAIKHARKYYPRKNVNYKVAGVRDCLKSGRKYDAIFMFAVIEHFEPTEGTRILREIKKSLNKDGIFFGSTPIFKDNRAYNFEHKNEFQSEASLFKFLHNVFDNVNMSTSVWPGGRVECYFECKI